MSRGRWDRNRAARTQRWEQDYQPLAGGLDESSSGFTADPKTLRLCLNVEEVFGEQGYKFIKGYERFDGRSRPSKATYALQPYDAGTATIAVGSTVTNATTATGTVVTNTITSGSVGGGDAAGVLLLANVSGEWADNDPIRIGGVQKATANGVTEPGSIGTTGHETYLTAVWDYLRSLIQAVPGSGAILGGCVFDGGVLAARNAADGLTSAIYQSSSSGWTLVRSGLHPNANYQFLVANFSGDPDQLRAYYVNGKDRNSAVSLSGGTAYNFAVYGTEGTTADLNAVALGAQSFTIIEPTRTWTAGQDITAWDSETAGRWMRGTVTSYNSGTNTLVMNVTSTGGSGSPTYGYWIGLSDFSDKPYLLAEHKDHMWWAYPKGQLQTSALGDPGTIAGGTAAAFGIGGEITALQSIKGDALAVFTEQTIDVISGSSSLDWSKQPYSKNVGAIANTVADNDGNPVFLSTRGVTSLQATQSFGDVEAGIFSQKVSRTMSALQENFTCARMAYGNNQYRLYADDGSCLRFTLRSGNSVVRPKDVSVGFSEYPVVPACVWGGVIDGVGRMFFGTSDGYVIEEDCGTSFDGTDISYLFALQFNHLKSAPNDKQLHKMELEVLAPDPVTFSVRLSFDYDDGTFRKASQSTDVQGTPGRWGVDNWQEFFYDRPEHERLELPVDGICRNVSMMIWTESGFVRPATVQGLLTFFTNLGVRV